MYICVYAVKPHINRQPGDRFKLSANVRCPLFLRLYSQYIVNKVYGMYCVSRYNCNKVYANIHILVLYRPGAHLEFL